MKQVFSTHQYLQYNVKRYMPTNCVILHYIVILIK